MQIRQDTRLGNALSDSATKKAGQERTEETKRSPMSEMTYAFGFVMVLTLLYVAGYYVLVTKDTICQTKFLGGGKELDTFQPYYRVGDEWAKTIFSPIHDADRKVRPDYWEQIVLAR